MNKTTEISPGLLLHTSDRLGVNRAVIAIEYELEVRKNKLVSFEIDFTGSANLALEGEGNSLSRRTTVEPGNRSLVAVVHVVDPSKSWSLETKYTWIEENPGTVQPGQSKKEKLAEGITLTTSRSGTPDTFSFHLLNEKNVPVNVTLDCSKSVNLSMMTFDEPGSTAKKDTSRVHLEQISIILPPFSRAHVCSLVVKDPLSGYQLKTRWSWTEQARASTGMPARVPHASPVFEPSSTSSRQQNNLITPSFATSNMPDSLYQDSRRRSSDLLALSNSPSMALVPSYSQDLTTRFSNEGLQGHRQFQSTPSRPRLKREEISKSVFLETEIFDHLAKTEIVYSLQVAKDSRITFEADFSESSNLALVPSGGLVCDAVVEPHRKVQVARLRVVDAHLGWKLVCRYKWQEEDIVSSDAIIPIDVSSSKLYDHPLENQKPVRMNEVRALLNSLNLEAYADFFEAEELSLDLLRVMAKDEGEFRRSLESLGVNKMGHRERILVAVKNLPLAGN